VPSAHAGVLRRILVQEGDTVAIGTPLAIITDSADEG
jgi:pyruvate/2-oxoglutarate dehydrogenase complex dihydrolipoamide acyltransferase (E2) component